MKYANITDIKISGKSNNPYVYGYGRKIKTEYMIKTNWVNIWKRVYCMCYSNNGTLYINTKNDIEIVNSLDIEKWLIDRK